MWDGHLKRSLCKLRLERSKILSSLVVLKNGPEGGLSGDSFPPWGLCSCLSQIIEIFEKINGGGGGSRTLVRKAIFPVNSNCYVT
jgi:hypothetical protein